MDLKVLLRNLLDKPFYEYFRQEPILSRPWQMFFAVLSDQVTGLGAPPMQEAVVTGQVLSKPWLIWFQKAGELQGISEPPVKAPLLNQEFVQMLGVSGFLYWSARNNSKGQDKWARSKSS